jgi:flavorubredoxin
LINIIRPKKRFSKWAKKAQNDDIDIVKETYGYSQKKAEIALSLLSKAQINSLKQKQEKGGLKK